jgi:hypothetical protein
MKRRPLPAYITAGLLFIPAMANGGVTTDGSIGPAGPHSFSGKSIEVRPQYGKQEGGNVFYSFKDFDLTSGRTATFDGAPGTQNIIVRWWRHGG